MDISKIFCFENDDSNEKSSPNFDKFVSIEYLLF